MATRVPDHLEVDAVNQTAIAAFHEIVLHARFNPLSFINLSVSHT